MSNIEKTLDSKKSSDSIISRVVPGVFETIALSKPTNLLKTEDLPEFTGPIKTIFFFWDPIFLFIQPPTKRSNLFLRFFKSPRRPSASKKLSPSSEKSISASTLTLIPSISSAKKETCDAKPPSKEFVDKTTPLSSVQSMRSDTASASLRLILLFKKALFVNSPPTASSKPTPLKAFDIPDITASPPWA